MHHMANITMKETRSTLKDGCKTVFQVDEETTEEITHEFYDKLTNDDTLTWFRCRGGSETVTRGYTAGGYEIVRLVSKNPDKSKKIERVFSITV